MTSFKMMHEISRDFATLPVLSTEHGYSYFIFQSHSKKLPKLITKYGYNTLSQ